MSMLIRLAVAAAVALAAAAAAGQSFPSRPVQLIVPFPPGGTTDILAREVAQQLSARWNVAVVVENKAGASGAIGSEQLIRSAPDGHTLMITATHHVINPSLRKLPYDTRKDFSSIAQVATVPNVLVVHPSVPATDVQELIRLAREKPGSLSFGSTGVGGANHLSGELFKSMAGVDMVHIPYKGAAPALNDLLGGQIPVMFDSLPGVIQHLKSGKLRALGVTTARRVASMPEIPTIGEAGVPGFEATAWFGLYGPANLPPDVLARIVADVDAVLQSERTRERFTPQGAEVIPMTQPEFARFVDAEIDKWAEVVDRAGLKPQ